MSVLKNVLATALLIVAACSITSAQSLPVGSPALEDYYRRGQLLGTADTTVSMMVRPLQPAWLKKDVDVFYPDDEERRLNLLGFDRKYLIQGAGRDLKLLPLSVQTQFNSDHPYGWNDGAMIPAKGLQTLISAGIFYKKGPLTIQLRPELVMAANSSFDTFNKNHYEVIFARYYDIYNNIDLPARFGSNPYVRAFWGQSAVKLNFGAVAFGISTENLWWGPGIRNSLLMSNSAPGFKHLTLNTNRPIKTPVGSFEGQLIAGRLENSGYHPLTPDTTFLNSPLYVPKPTDWRYLSGIVLSWQPRWVPGLFLGYSQTRQMYSKDLNSLGDYLPFFSQTKSVTAPDAAIENRDQRSAVFMRWLWTKEHAEVYFEFGHNNYNRTARESALEPENSRGYTFGLRKALPFNTTRGESLLIGVEATVLQENDVNKTLQGYSWYVNKYIRQGYTNRGEILGAGIGPGANLQSLDVSWVRGLKRLGLQLERYVHNNDFYYYAYSDSKDTRRHWVDLSLGASGEWNYKNLIFNAKLAVIRSLNYQWFLLQKPTDPYWINGKDVTNVQLQAGVTYRF
ncbi:capsule assembly Wzi family protein [Mucilaginibacter sp. CSA2-8R]|uniref:capsule assembly Wzi family protein n=1 Tax=Mucilaginibacter sp. CSA2-8R TaxID=3141542 RepID=UPI00315CC98C